LYGWLPGEKSKLFSHNLDLMVRLSSYLEDGSLMTFAQTLGWEFTTKSQWQGVLSMVVSREHLRDSLELLPDEVYIPDGTYQFVNFRGMLQTAASKSFFVNILTETGQYYDGGRFSTRLQPQWNISKHFELGGFYGFDYVNFRSRDVSMSNLLIGFKALYMLNTKLSVSAYVQYNTVSKGINSNFKFRYNPREGNDFYLVFNEGRNTSLDRESPRLPVYDARTVLIKYTYTFNL
jgi:hypothetical protein